VTPEKLLRILNPTYSREFLQGLLCARAILLEQQPKPRSESADFAAALEYVQGLVDGYEDREIVLLVIDDLLLRSYLESIGYG
jgi:hypothetical protein